jgi:peptidyl-prolyl cis-trans isomerase D
MVMQSLSTGTTGKIFKTLLGLILFAAVAGLVMTDVGGFFRNGGVSRTDVARVGKSSISIAEFSHNYRRALQQSGINEDTARQMNLPLMVLQQDIGRAVLLQAATRMGIRVPDTFVAQNLKQQLNAMKMPGTDQEKLDIVLRQQDVTERHLVDLLRGDFAINMVTAAVSPVDVTIPDDIIREINSASTEKRVAELVTITPASLKKAVTVNDKALEKFYAENKENYRTEEKRSLSFLVFPKSLFTPTVTISDADAETYYSEHKNQFMKPARVRLEQVIVSDEAAAKKIAEEKPTSFAGTIENGAQPVATDWYTQSGMPKTLADAVFNDKKATGIVGPVKSDLGWHVLRVESYEDSTPAAFADVKDLIKRQLQDEALDTAVNDFSENVDKLVTGGGSLDDLAQQYKLTPKTVSDITQRNAEDKVKALDVPTAVATRLHESAFTLSEDELSPLIDTPTGDYLLIQVKDVTPSVIPALKTVRDRVTQDARAYAQAQALTDLAETVIGGYDSTKPDTLTKALQANGLSASRTAAATMPEAEKNNGPDVARMIFTLSPDNDLSYVTGDNTVTLVHLVSVARSTAEPDKKTHDETAKAVASSMTQELQQQFIGAWQNKLGVAVNDDLIRKQFLEKQE